MKLQCTLFFCVAMAGAGCQRIGGGVQGSGIAKSETRDVGTFDEVEFSGAGRLEITVGKPSPLTISGDDNIVPLIQTKVKGSCLVIRPDESVNPKTELVLKVGVADVKNLDCSGATSLVVTGVRNESLRIDLSGAGSMKLTGQTGKFELSISGAGSANAEDLVARDVTAKISGAGSADVNATQSLNANISGVGNVRYKGDPKVTESISGVGSVKKKA